MTAGPHYAEVIGDPVAHSKSPLIHGFWLDRLGIAASYHARHVPEAGLAEYFTQRRQDAAWRGCNVTIPHKQRVAPHVAELDDAARGVGAVNTIYRHDDGRLIGTNTDLDGVGEAIAGSGLPRGPVVVLGSGGAARAAFAYLASRTGDVRVLARDGDKARQALHACGLAAEVLPFSAIHVLNGASVLINATQLGMTGQAAMPDAIVGGLARMHAGSRVFDMVYAPIETPLLAAAAACGLVTADGLTMLIGQAAHAFARFFGQPAPREHDAELRALLTR